MTMTTRIETSTETDGPSETGRLHLRMDYTTSRYDDRYVAAYATAVLVATVVDRSHPEMTFSAAAGSWFLFVASNVVLNEVAKRGRNRVRIEILRVLLSAPILAVFYIVSGGAVLDYWYGFGIMVVGTAVGLVASFPHLNVGKMCIVNAFFYCALYVGLYVWTAPELTRELLVALSGRAAFLFVVAAFIVRNTDFWVDREKQLVITKEAEKRAAGLEAAARVEREKVQELSQLNDELKSATAQLVQAEKLSALGELTAGISHEMKQPLNVIGLISQTARRELQRRGLNPDVVDSHFADIHAHVRRMAAVVDHMSIFTRRADDISDEPVDLNDLFRSALTFFRQQMVHHDIELVETYGANLPLVVANPVLLEQVFINLLSNARRAVDDLRDERRKEIHVSTYANRGNVVAEVHDNGCGLSAVTATKVFDPFYSTSEPGRGTGLGLAISRRIVEESSGRIELASEPDRGTTFRVILRPCTAES